MNRVSWGSRQNMACAALALVVGLGIGWLDLHITEVMVTILALLLGGLLRLRTAEPIRLDPRVAFVALAFALVGCYGGVVLRKAVARFTISS